MAEKVQYGKVTMYRCQCPSCNEVLFQDNMVFDCDDCKLSFRDFGKPKNRSCKP